MLVLRGDVYFQHFICGVDGGLLMILCHRDWFYRMCDGILVGKNQLSTNRASRHHLIAIAIATFSSFYYQPTLVIRGIFFITCIGRRKVVYYPCGYSVTGHAAPELESTIHIGIGGCKAEAEGRIHEPQERERERERTSSLLIGTLISG